MPNTDAADFQSTPASAPSRRRGKGRWLRRIAWVLGVLLALLLVMVVGVVLWLRAAEKAALPQLDGDLHLAGLSAPVTVRRDAHGVPHIQAGNEQDLFTAQGYVTAQDRLWQMDAFRRNSNGELAELLGPSLVRHDTVQRVLQFKNTAQRVYDRLAPADRARLDAYARGVNLFIDQHQDSLPAEFKLLFYKPQPWKGVDSISVGLMMVETLDTHFDAKIMRQEIREKLHNPKLEGELYPVGSWRDRPPTGAVIDLTQPRLPPPATPTNDDEDDSSQAGAAHVPASEWRELRKDMGLPACEKCASGSNNWVIAGNHTASGKPLLSNDMHLGITVPNIWFMADLEAPAFHAAGVTLPGFPFVIAGHNEHVAWGFTALFADVQDVYNETLDGKGNYQGTDGAWHPLRVDHETIHVRGSKDVVLDVQSTEHGPLLTPLLTKQTKPISLKWTLYDETLNALPLYEMNTAANWTEFSAALANWCWPTQNLVYSDDQGHIAYHAIGKVPLRPGGLDGVPVSDTTHEWKGYIPYDAMPSAFDPASGFLATANSNVTTNTTPYPLTLEWLDPYRAERIYKQLQGRDHLTPKDMLAVQTDIYSEVDQEIGHRLAYAIDHADNPDARLKKAADLLRSWDGRLATDSAAASVVTEARRAFWPLILEPKLGQDIAGDYRWAESDFAEEEIIMHASADWLPPGYKNWDELLTDAVRKGMENGKAPTDVAHWTYGSWHVIDIEHPLAQFLPWVSRIAGTGPQPLSGDDTTVKQVGKAFGPSQRFTMDWSNIDGSTEDIVLGESGDPYSAYFRDQWNDWYGGTTFALPFSTAAVAAQTQHTQRLVP